MDNLTAFILIAGSIVAGIGFIGAAALLFGIDSRPTIGDDHAR
jgi:hypothetical protein